MSGAPQDMRYRRRVLRTALLTLRTHVALVFGLFGLFGLVGSLAACSGPAVGSVGAVLGVDAETGAVHIREMKEGLAADKAGLLPGDEILLIDGVYARDLSAAQIRQKLRGNVGSKVELTVVRGEEVLRVSLVREALVAGSKVAAPKKEERVEP